MLDAGHEATSADLPAEEEQAPGESEQPQEHPLGRRGVPTPSRPRGGNAAEPDQAEDGDLGDSSQKLGHTNSRRARTVEINSLAEWYSTPCNGPSPAVDPVFDEGDAEGHPEALPLTPTSSLPTPASDPGLNSSCSDFTFARSRSSSTESLSTKRHSPADWCIADGVLQSGRTPNTQDLCLRSPRARKPVASLAPHASRLASAPALPTLMGSRHAGVSLGKIRSPAGGAAGGLSPEPRSRSRLGSGGISLTPRLCTPRVRVWAPGSSRAHSGSCFVWQEVLSMFGSFLCGLQSHCGVSSKGGNSAPQMTR